MGSRGGENRAEQNGAPFGTVVSMRRKSRAKQRKRSARGKRLIARDGVAESGSQKHVRRKMRKRADARQTDCGGETVRYQRDPAVTAIPGSDDCGDRKNTGCVSGWKRAPLKGRLVAVEEGVSERLSGRDITRALSASYGFHCQIHHRAVGVGHPGEQGCAYLIRVMPSVASNHQSYRDGDHLCRGNGSIEGVIDVVEVPGMRPKIWHHVGIGDDQPGGSADYR